MCHHLFQHPVMVRPVDKEPEVALAGRRRTDRLEGLQGAGLCRGSKAVFEKSAVAAAGRQNAGLAIGHLRDSGQYIGFVP